MTATAQPRRRLPPHAKRLVALLASGRRPVTLGGAFVAALDWKLARGWPRFVLPPDETVAGFDLRFVAGVDVLVFYCPGHDAQHLRACVDELRRCRARLVVPVALPSVECEA